MKKMVYVTMEKIFCDICEEDVGNNYVPHINMKKEPICTETKLYTFSPIIDFLIHSEWSVIKNKKAVKKDICWDCFIKTVNKAINEMFLDEKDKE